MERQFIHAHFVDLVSQKLEKEGYTRERIMNNLNSLYKNVIKN